MTKWIGDPPEKCDLCGLKITEHFIDGKTTHGPWAIMCAICTTLDGVGLGKGSGQLYKKIGDDFIKVEG
jgi:hypothetical protein